jgi:hypothetical protein
MLRPSDEPFRGIARCATSQLLNCSWEGGSAFGVRWGIDPLPVTAQGAEEQDRAVTHCLTVGAAVASVGPGGSIRRIYRTVMT